MTASRRERIGRAFSAARDYDRHADLQRRVARSLAERIGRFDPPPVPRVLEIGCGTGFLTEALLEQGLGGEWLITDLSPAMVSRCRKRIGERPGLTFATLDGEHATLPQGRFDLICASLAMQWFDDIATGVQRLCNALAPGGHLVFTTLASGTFAQWRAAHAAVGVEAGTPPFPGGDFFAAMHPQLQVEPPQVDVLDEAYPNARAFLRSLKAIGAGTAAGDHRPLPPKDLRRVMAQFDCAGSTVSYEVVTCHFGAKA